MEKEVLIETLRDLVVQTTDKPVTRDYFRITTKLADSEWVAHFGNWKEFRRGDLLGGCGTKL